MDLADYWEILVRRKFQFLLPFVAVVAIAAVLAMTLPPVFRSEATILIQRQTIPSNLVTTTVTGYVQEQIEQIRQRIITSDSLEEIAQEFNLYPEELQADRQTTLRKIRQNIGVSMQDVRASSPDTTGNRTATIAFTVSYSSADPSTARAVTNEVARRFLAEQRLARGAQAAQVSEFLDAEAEALRSEIAELEAQLATFKQEEMRQLPELMSMNLSLYERTEQQIESTENRVRALQDSINAIRAEMSLTPPYQAVITEGGQRMLSASERLSMLTATYLRDSARYSAQHPDIVRLRREIRVLAEETGSGARADELMNELVNLQEQLRRTRQQYAEGHPEVQRLETAIAAVQRGFQSTLIAPEGGRSQVFQTPPDNPRYVALKTQLDASESNLVIEQQRLGSLREKLVELEQRLYQTPVVDRDFRSLSRGYEDAQRKFSDLNQKLLEARIAETLEAGQGAEQWTLISAAFLPTLPDSPNRIGIALLGVLLGFGAGLGLVVVTEYTDRTIRGPRLITATFGAPPLAVIPRM
jgi:polysaccharide biosynthesis transport protein